MTTMKEIAEKANVSQATVSRVLTGSTSVSMEKRARVMEWVRKLNFEPNQSARTLAANRSQLIGVILPDLMNPFFAEILSNIEMILSRNGYNVILANSEGDSLREKDILKSLKARQVDGILVVPSPETIILDELREQNVKSVVITLEYPGIDCIGVSHRKGGILVAEHMLSNGIERFAYFGPSDDDKFMGFRDTLAAAGVQESNIDLIGNQDWWLSMMKRGFHSAEHYLETHRAGSRLGVFSVNDPFALGVVHAAQDLGISIPEELAVVGFDNTFICENVRPTLTSVAQPIEEIGRLSVELLLKRIESGFGDVKQQHIQLEPRLVKRESS